MKYLITRSLFLTGLLFLFAACQEQEVTFLPSGASAFPSSELVEASFYGRLLDHEMQPVMEAEVWIEDRMALSDSLGDWIIPKVEVASRQVYVKVEAQGYFAASRVLSALPNSMNLVRIMPTRKESSYSIQSSDGGVVQLPDGSSVTFQPGSFIIEATGASYSGEVNVFAYYIDGQSESSQMQMPGRLESTTESAALISFGMIVADLESSSGEPLQLATGMPATIRYEQAQLEANAPETIPLWHFDEGVGTWVKDGFSVREGNSYVGEVTHFTWWNCDWPGGIVDFCIEFSCGDSVPTISSRSADHCIYAVVTTSWGTSRTTRAVMDASLKFCDILPDNASVIFYLERKDGGQIEIGPLDTGTGQTDFGVHEIDCDLLNTECGVFTPPPPRPTGPPLPQPPVMVSSTLVWTAANCPDVDQPYLIRIASTQRNARTIILEGPSLVSESITVDLPEGKRINFSMLDVNTGKVLDTRSYYPHSQIEVGALNPATGVIDGVSYDITGTLKGCNAPLGDVSIHLLAPGGTLIAETKSSPIGRFSLRTTACDARRVTVKIFTTEGEQVVTTDLYENLDLGEIILCAADGNYYWKAKVNGALSAYLTCNGRAGSSGWVAYAASEPDPSAPYFGVVHTDKIQRSGTYEVGPDKPIRFNGFRLGRYAFTPSSHPFVGELKVTEYGGVATGVFAGTCEGSDGEQVNIEVEMRFVRP